MSRFKDFDAFWQEKKAEPLEVKVFGKKYKLPATLPAALVIRLMRLMAEDQGDAPPPPGEVVAMLEGMFGKKVLDEWAAKGITMDQMVDILEWCVQQYSQGLERLGKRKTTQEAPVEDQT